MCFRMTKLADARINSFGIESPEAGFESPSEDPIFVLTSSQLRGIITRALQPLQDEVFSLREDRDKDRKEMAALRSKLASLESLQESEISRVCVDIAQDRRRLYALEKVEPQPLQKDRGEILRALIATNGGKMLAKDARQKMHMDKATFSRLLASLADEINTRPLHQDKRKQLLIIK